MTHIGESCAACGQIFTTRHQYITIAGVLLCRGNACKIRYFGDRPAIELIERINDTGLVDFDGDDVYDTDEVACPHCGHVLRIVMRATLSVAAEPDGGDGV